MNGTPDDTDDWRGGWWRHARRVASPNFNPRPADARVDTVVLHSISLPPGSTVWVAMDARMDEIYAGCYCDDGDAGWRPVVEPALTTPEALHALWCDAPPAFVAGSALAAFGDRLHTGAARRAPDEHGRATALGWLAATGLARGDGVRADQALPVYLRDKVAQTTAEREAAKALRDAAGAAR